MLDQLRRLFVHDHWANQEALRAVRAATPPAADQATRLLAHIVGAEQLWLARLQPAGQPSGPTPAVWPEWPVERLGREIDAMAAQWRGFLDSISAADLAVRVAYRNSKGQGFTNTIGDVLVHVTSHSTYHRGQIALSLRSHGAEPAYTDFIGWVRQVEEQQPG